MKSLFIIFVSLFQFISNSSAETLTFEHYFKIGNSYYKQKDWDNAIDAYLRAIKINDESAVAHYRLGWAYFYKWFEVRDNNLRNETYEDVKKLNAPNSDCTRISRDGENDITNELNEKQTQQWKKTIELDDSIAGAHYMLGTHYYGIENFDKAEKELKRAIELDPESGNSYGVLASVYKKIGKNDLAIEFQKKQLAIEPDYDQARFQLMMLYHKVGMKKEAIEQYNILKNKKSDSINSLKYILGPDNYLHNQAVHQTE